MSQTPWIRREEVGEAVLYLGDCRAILPTLPAASIDAVVSDPPYGISLAPQRGLTDAIQGDGREEAKALWAFVAGEVPRLAKPNTSHLFWTGWSETWTKEVLEAHLRVKACIVWGKNNFGIGYYTRPQHEMAWYCHLGEPPVLERPVSDLWLVPKVQAPEHSCEKPIPLLERSVALCTPSGGVVLAPFAGSGSTGAACLRLGRSFIGIEVAEEHFDLALGRLREAHRQPRLIEAYVEPKPATFFDELGAALAKRARR